MPEMITLSVGAWGPSRNFGGLRTGFQGAPVRSRRFFAPYFTLGGARPLLYAVACRYRTKFELCPLPPVVRADVSCMVDCSFCPGAATSMNPMNGVLHHVVSAGR